MVSLSSSLSWSCYCNINNPSPRPVLSWNCYTTAPPKNPFPLRLFSSYTFSSFHSINYNRLISMSKPCCHRTNFSSPSFSASSSSSMAEASSTLNPNPDATLLLRDICSGKVPEHILKRAEEMGFIVPTDVQKQSLPILLSGRDCILHAQTCDVYFVRQRPWKGQYFIFGYSKTLDDVYMVIGVGYEGLTGGALQM